MNDFVAFPKIARLSREIVITEKIDGTNGVIKIYIDSDAQLGVVAGSRTRWITPEDDNHGFAKWVDEHNDELITGLGYGTHYGEWWGSGIQRGYGLTKGEKRFSLFNVKRWTDEDGCDICPSCCEVVPVLGVGEFSTNLVEACLANLKEYGSKAVSDYMNPEGIVIYHTGANMMFKKTIEKDDEWKGKAKS